MFIIDARPNDITILFVENLLVRILAGFTAGGARRKGNEILEWVRLPAPLASDV